MKQTLIMLVGLPSSGKSTWATNYMGSTPNVALHSSDELRRVMLNNIHDQSQNSKVFEQLHKNIIVDLKDGLNVIYDATNLSSKRRRAFLNTLNNKKNNLSHIHTKAVVLALPYNECIDRDMVREKKVGSGVIERMYKSFQMPWYSEGWDDIEIKFSEYNELDFILSDLFNILYTINQHNPHHTKTIGEHCSSVMNFLFVRNGFVKSNLCMAGRLHDIGKIYTGQFKDSKGKNKLTMSFYNHENISSYESMFYLDVLEYSHKDIIEICVLVNYHMRTHSIDSEKSRNKLISLVGLEIFEKLILLREADIACK